MSRHPSLCCRVLLAFLAMIPLAASPSPAVADEDRPNIVVILVDDMGFSDIASYGGEIDTPSLDRLAAGGLRFTQFYNYARCCPTRAALLTGLYPHQAEMGWMTAANLQRPGYTNQLSDEAATIPEVLKAAGYGTYMSGKWHLSHDSAIRDNKPNGSWPTQRGFDRFFGTIFGGGSYFTPASLSRDLDRIDDEFPDDFYYTNAIADNAATFIREHDQQRADSPFFLYVAYTAPHWPLHVPADDWHLVDKYAERYKAGYDELRRQRYERQIDEGIIPPEAELHPRDSRVPAWDMLDDERKQDRILRMSLYAAQIELMDRGVGRIVDELERMGRLDNTLILFLSDNGGCEESGLWGFNRNDEPIGTPDSFASYGRTLAHLSNAPFREYKHWVHEGGIATPLIAHWPNGIKQAGGLTHEVGSIVDFMATCVDVAGASYPDAKNGNPVPPTEGVSLVPAFAGESLGREAPIFWEHEGNRAVRDGKWKLVAKGINSPWELYDMQADRTETNDLAGEQPERVERMAAQWQRWAESHKVLPMDERPWGERIAAAEAEDEAGPKE